MSDLDAPRCTQISINWNISGKIAVVDYGKHTSGYGASFSRTYEIPDGWDRDAIDEFQEEERQHLQELLDPIDQAGYDERIEEANWT